MTNFDKAVVKALSEFKQANNNTDINKIMIFFMGIFVSSIVHIMKSRNLKIL